MNRVRESSSDYIYELCPIEGSQATFKKLQYSCVYSDNCHSKITAASISQNVQRSFTKLTEIYPILVGHRVQDSGRNLIVISPSDKTRKRIYQHEERQLSVCDFKQIKHRRDLWPSRLGELLDSQARDVDCLLSVSIIQLKDGCIITFSVSHILADAAGAAILLQQWASLAIQMDGEDFDASKNIQPAFPVDFNHSHFWHKLKKYPSAVHPFAQYVNKQDIGNLGDVNPKLAKFYKKGSLGKGELEMHVLYVSNSSIAKISTRFNSPGSRRPLHGVQILYALLWQRFIAAVLKDNSIDLNEPALLNFLHNIRSLVSSPYYVGNGVSTVCIVLTIGEVINMPTIDLAYKIKQQLNSLTPGAVVNLAESIVDTKSMFMQKVFCISSQAASILTISNASRMPFYDVDFGLGKPEAVLWDTRPTENMSSWLPSKDGGVNINFGIHKDMYLILKQDTILGEFIDFAN